jgi:putative transposase
MDLDRAVDSAGEILDIFVRRRRDKAAAGKLLRKRLTKLGFAPSVPVTDTRPSGRAARRRLGLSARHEPGLRKNNRAENSHQAVRRRERPMPGVKSLGSARRFLSAHAAIHNPFNRLRHLVSRRRRRRFRPDAAEPWKRATAT